ncbi:RHS repeat-associated core domain-containing protein [Actinoplanes sp. RD1]|uniref:RHS repeat-associated core domain-containing protein n=1 Tax=Actinoplanes sp. RD1 TaxID=3064538 RepID=UPI0027427BE4|nr:RHS repeat-associated core domain-containing protein [Actinoplanes sp. RD1]
MAVSWRIRMRFSLVAPTVPVVLATLLTGPAAAAPAAGTVPPAELPARAAAPAPAGPRENFYDASGQLAGVVDKATGAATYRYDDAGNVLSVDRIATGDVGVFAVVPARGPAGTKVEISGTGFATTPAGNTVTVDGIAATVTAATATRLTVTVPAGVSDGAVQVTVGAKSARSPRNFRIEAAAPPPTVTALSADRGNRNDLVTITGTGFDTDPARNVVTFQRTVAQVQSATPTSLVVRVPVTAGSGKVSVRTPAGTATSAGDFLVAPPGYAIGNLAYAGRVGVGKPTVTATIAAGKSALLLIDGVSGEQASLRFEGNTIPVRSALRLYTPYGGDFAKNNGDPLNVFAGGTLVQDLPPFVTTGTYAIVIDPNDDAAGAVKVTATSTLSGGTLTKDGSGVPFQITAAGQTKQYSFTATTGDWISFGLTDIDQPGNTYVVKLTAPDNSVFTWQARLSQYTPTMVYHAKQTGTFKVNVGFGATELGFGRIWLSSVITGATMTANGAAVPVTIQRPGQSVRLPYAGTVGQTLQLGYTDNTLAVSDRPAYPSGIIGEPDDVQVLLDTGWAETRDMPAVRKAGTHNLFITGWQAVGSLKVWLSTPTEAGAIPVNTKKALTVDRPGRDIWLDYNGTAGKPLYLSTLDRRLMGEVNLQLYRPDGIRISSGRTIDYAALPSTGKYRIKVDPETAGTGTLSVAAVEPIDTGALTPNAPATAVSVTLPGRRIVGTFTGTAGQRLTLAGLSEKLLWWNLKVYKPDNTQLDFFGVVHMPVGQDLPPLPVAGTYRFELTNASQPELYGDLQLFLSNEVDGGTAVTDGAALPMTFTRPGQNGKISFTAVAGDVLDVQLGSAELGAYITIYNSAGTVVLRHSWLYYVRTQLPSLAAGAYTMVFDPSLGSTGTITAQIKRHSTPLAADKAQRKLAAPRTAEPPACATPAEVRIGPAGTVSFGAGERAPGERVAPAAPQRPAGCADSGWKPDAKNLDGQDWTTHGQPVPVRERALQFPVGVTGVVGKVLDTADKPLAHVSVTAAGRKATTDAQGRFALTGLPAGHVSLRVDGRSAAHGGHEYGVFDIGVDITRDAMLILPYTVFLPELDKANTVTVPSPTVRETVLTTRAIPGLEVRIPAGTTIRDADGKVATELSLTAIPIDRPPFPLPPTKVPVYFTVQPGGGVLFPQGATIVYPNYTHEPPGTRTQFWNYDPDGKGWHIYGLGRVSKDGKQIVPDPGVRFYRLTGAMTAVPGLNPALWAPKPGTHINDPVDPATGLFVDTTTDLVVDDVMPISISRTYQQGDTDMRPFGVGTNFNYGLFPWTPGVIGSFDFQQFDLVQPDGAKVHFHRTSPGTDFVGAEYLADPTPTIYDGATVKWNGDGWDVSLVDGTVLVLGNEAPLQSIRDKYGNITTISRATAPPGTDGILRPNGPVTQITSPNGRWIKLTYSSTNPPRVSAVEDNIGRKVAYKYDATGHLVEVKDARGGITTYTYDAQGRMATITDPRRITYLRMEYDAAGRVKTQKAADDTVTAFDYTLSGTAVTETRVTDPRGHVRRITFNANGFMVDDTKAYGTDKAQTFHYDYDASGVRKAATTDALGRRTTWIYNAKGQVTQTTVLAGTADARTEKFDFAGPHSELTKFTDSYGKETIYEPDTRGALKSVTDAMKRKTLVGVDGSGLITTMTDPANKVFRTDYQGADPVRTTDETGRVTTTGFDAIGRPVTETDARGARTDTTYDAAGQVLTTTDPLGLTTRIAYDENGNRKSVEDPRGGRTITSYDTMDRVEWEQDALGEKETFAYDENGNPRTRTTRTGVTTTETYDELDRTVTSTTGSATIAFTYDLGDRLRSVADPVAGPSSVDYDGLNRVTKETTAGGTVSYAYSPTVRDRTMTLPGKPAIRHVYDANGDLQEVQQGGTAVTTVSRDVVGRPERVGTPATTGVSQTYGWTDAGEVKSITYKVNTTTLGDLGYQYDGSGLPVLTTGTYSRQQLPDAFGPATYDAANRLDTLGAADVSYDKNGNLESDGTTTYTWNDRDQLSGLSRDGLTATFGYATDGRRLTRTVNGKTTTFLYDGQNPVQEMVNGTVTATTLSAGLDGYLTRDVNGTVKRYQTDAIGSVIGLVDAAGAGASYAYQPFGTTTVTGDDGGNALRFTGREDDATGLYFYRQRYYSPALQRFASEDPLGPDGGVNLHEYAANRPTALIDPMGTKPISLTPPYARRHYKRPTRSVRDDALKRSPMCPYCGASKSTDYEHVNNPQKYDWARGGHVNTRDTRSGRVNDPTNTTGACGPCNSAKQDRPIGTGPGEYWPPAWPAGKPWPFGGAPKQ